MLLCILYILCCLSQNSSFSDSQILREGAFQMTNSHSQRLSGMLTDLLNCHVCECAMKPSRSAIARCMTRTDYISKYMSPELHSTESGGNGELYRASHQQPRGPSPRLGSSHFSEDKVMVLRTDVMMMKLCRLTCSTFGLNEDKRENSCRREMRSG